MEVELDDLPSSQLAVPIGLRPRRFAPSSAQRTSGRNWNETVGWGQVYIKRHDTVYYKGLH